MLDSFHIIAFTHRNIEINEVGLLHIEEENQAERLMLLKKELQLQKLL